MRATLLYPPPPGPGTLSDRTFFPGYGFTPPPPRACVFTHQLHLDHLELLLSLSPPRMLSLQHSTGHTSTGGFWHMKLIMDVGEAPAANRPCKGCQTLLPIKDSCIHCCAVAVVTVISEARS